MFHSYFERKNEKVLAFNIAHFPNLEINASLSLVPPSNRHHWGCLLEEIQYIWLAERGKIYISFVSKGDNNKCYVKFGF